MARMRMHACSAGDWPTLHEVALLLLEVPVQLRQVVRAHAAGQVRGDAPRAEEPVDAHLLRGDARSSQVAAGDERRDGAQKVRKARCATACTGVVGRPNVLAADGHSSRHAKEQPDCLTCT